MKFVSLFVLLIISFLIVSVVNWALEGITGHTLNVFWSRLLFIIFTLIGYIKLTPKKPE